MEAFIESPLFPWALALAVSSFGWLFFWLHNHRLQKSLQNARHHEKEFLLLLEATGLILIKTDSRGHLLYASQTLFSLFKSPQAPYHEVDKPLETLNIFQILDHPHLHLVDPSLTKEYVKEHISEGHNFTDVAVEILHPEGPLTFLLSFSCIAEASLHYLFTLKDHTSWIEPLESLHQQVFLDPLTLLDNRQKFEQIRLYFPQEERFPITFLMADIDDFKKINDVYGHIAGDALLQSLGKILRDSLKPEDTPIRYGGDEFFIYLPHTGKERGLHIVEDIRARLKDLRPRPDNALSLSLSIGLYVARKPEAFESALQKVDNALYEAKYRH